MTSFTLVPQLATYILMLIGLSLLGAWAFAFRRQTYLAWLGLCLLSLAVLYLRRVGIITHIWPFMLVSVLFAVAAMRAGLKETARRLSELRESQAAAEEAFFEIVKAGLAKSSPTDDALEFLEKAYTISVK